MKQRAITRIDTSRNDLFAFEVSGRIHEPDIEWMAATLQDAFTRLGKVDILILMKHWDGIDMSAAFDKRALVAQAQANSHVRKYGVVGAPAWAAAMINLFSPLTPVEEKTFELAEEPEAWEWIEGDRSFSEARQRAGNGPDGWRLMQRGTPNIAKAIAALLAVVLIASALWQLRAAKEGISISALDIGGIPATVYRPPDGKPAPAVVIAHGFAGSQQLMQSFAITFARNGYVAVTFDLAGHGRNTRPMNGDIDLIEGATKRLMQDVASVAAEARKLGDGRLAVLGHSMASDIVVRYAESDPSVTATIAVSMFSPAVTATAPHNLLVIVGDWESMLKREALRVVTLATSPQRAQPGVTYGDFTAGTARRVAFSPHVEHASVLFSATTMHESVAWLDGSFGFVRSSPIDTDGRGPWIAALFAGIVLLAWPLASLLPRVNTPAAGAGLGWRRIWPGLLLPMIATPLILRVAPTHFLPVLVADYLAVHFLVYGAIVLGWILWQRRGGHGAKASAPSATAFITALLAVIAFGFMALVWPLDSFVTSFMPTGTRPMLIAIMLIGTMAFFLSDEWLTRGSGAARGAYAVSKLAFLVSLAIAVALDPGRLFFLIIIVPVIALFFIVYGLLSRWIYGSTGQPLITGIASAIIFAWAIGVTFPLVAG